MTPNLLSAVRDAPNDERPWLALAAWLRDHGRDDEAATLRVFWPALQDSLAAGRSLESALDLVRANAWRLGPRAREIEEWALREC
ncbi:MAG: hypothetical protein J2P46_19170 [Zavarzinella sp.]|nr:hypothetical protein [Zavarzinella sp.]